MQTLVNKYKRKETITNRITSLSRFRFAPRVIKTETLNVKPLNLLHMNALRNKVQLIGNLGNDPEILDLDKGGKRAKFSIATNETYKNAKGEKVTDTQWHTVIAWGKMAEIAENYLGKGKEVALEGKLTSRSYETKTGEKRYVTEVRCTELLMLGNKE